MNIPIRFSNYEDCLIGVAQSHNNTVYAYDKELILEKIMKSSSCSYKDALAFFQSTINVNFGINSPVFFFKINDIVNININEEI